MVKPVNDLELHYPMITFLIIDVILVDVVVVAVANCGYSFPLEISFRLYQCEEII